MHDALAGLQTTWRLTGPDSDYTALNALRCLCRPGALGQQIYPPYLTRYGEKFGEVQVDFFLRMPNTCSNLFYFSFSRTHSFNSARLEGPTWLPLTLLLAV